LVGKTVPKMRLWTRSFSMRCCHSPDHGDEQVTLKASDVFRE